MVGIALCVLFRSGLYVFAGRISFDSDEAIFGLMAKHIAEGTGFAFFRYGQQYLMAVSSWMAVPFFWIAGPSIAALKFPALILNTVVVGLLVATARRELKLGAGASLLAAGFLLLPPVRFSGKLTEVACGNIEQYLVVLLAWGLRARPVALGVLLSIGILHREFVAYAFGALVLVDLLEARPVREIFRSRGKTAAIAAAIIVCGLQVGKLGTGATGITAPLHPAFLWHRVWQTPVWTVKSHLAQMLGYFDVWQPWGQIAAWGIAGFALLAVHAAIRPWALVRKQTFAWFLLFTSLICVIGYGIGAPRIETPGYRYNMLFIFFPISLALFFFALESGKTARLLGTLLLSFWLGVNAFSHAAFYQRFWTNPPVDKDQRLIDDLRARGVRYAAASFWDAYRISFRANENPRVVNTPPPVTILSYLDASVEERQTAVEIRRAPCASADRVEDWCLIPWKPSVR